MKRRLFFIAVLAALIGSALFLLAHYSGPQPFRLRVVRHGMDQGKPVVYFRVEGGGSRRIQIESVERVAGNRIDGPASSGLPFREFTPPDFWAPSQSWPIGFRVGRTEFGMMAPTNAPVWKLRVKIDKAVISGSWEWFRVMWTDWRSSGMSGMSFFKAMSSSWNHFYSTGYEDIESEPITNTVATSLEFSD